MAMRRGAFKRSSSESDLSEAHNRRASFSYPDGRSNRPSNEGMRPASAAASRGVVTCKALHMPIDAPSDSMWWMKEARRSLEQEIVLEGTLHVPAVQVASCTQQYGALPMDSAPPVKHLQAALSSADISPAEDKLIETAVCLATPDVFEEEPETETLRTMQGRNSQTTNNKAGAPSVRQDINTSNRSNIITTVNSASSRLELQLRMVQQQLVQGYSQQQRRRKRVVLQAAKAVRNSARTLYGVLTNPAGAAPADESQGTVNKLGSGPLLLPGLQR